jgi:chromosome segregation ATPase
MPGAVDIIAELQFQVSGEAAMKEATGDLDKARNVVRELTAATEKNTKATDDQTKKVQMSAAEYKKMQDALKNVKKDSNDYVDTLKKFGVEAEQAVKKHSSLRSQLREVREELARLEQSGQANTKKFRELSASAGQLQDQIGDTSNRIRVLASDTK